jgi:RimJ/RimL family protein N-acetyltransferase
MRTLADITLTPLDETALPILDFWLRDDELRERLSGMLPIQRWYRYVRMVPDYFAWMAYHSGIPVGMINAEMYPDQTASIGLLVNPQLRSQGYGKRILMTALTYPEFARLQLVEADIEIDNVASLRCFRSVGFVDQRRYTDDDGFRTLVYPMVAY